ncbi:hypothetical protein [Spiroplasma endosymbiont of Nebria brevicollis]|uniref:hypothetical protein n=1 Tax=Spiroplasma endosymbiont of Nebria brevicollis TaxID=3066284 RepID=UPI00313E4ED8
MPIEIENKDNTIIEEMKKQFKKMSVVGISSFAQTIFQSLISMKVAQTKLSWDNFKKSSMYSSGIIILNTFVEPKIFQ